MSKTASELAAQARWQYEAASELRGILERAGMEGLPAISWTVAPAGAELVARCTRVTSMAERRADYEAWNAALRKWAGVPATDRDTLVSGSGDVRLVAQWERYGHVTLTLAADIHAEDEQG